jgi:Vitamin B12 dependent methionine synthase, activation domain
MEILKDIPLSVEIAEVLSRLRLGNEATEDIKLLLEQVNPLISVKAAFKVSFVDSRSEDTVILDKTEFRSRVLRRHLDRIQRVFVYVVTIGQALEERGQKSPDPLEKYYIDEIGNVAVVKARTYLEDYLKGKYGLKKLSTMGPGQLKDWPLQEQRKLFNLLGNVENAIGVSIGEHMFMSPLKSLSGIYFPTEVTFFTCQLCSREKCPSRKAEYDEKMAEEYGLG